jgi:hypothetical protein
MCTEKQYNKLFTLLLFELKPSNFVSGMFKPEEITLWVRAL